MPSALAFTAQGHAVVAGWALLFPDLPRPRLGHVPKLTPSGFGAGSGPLALPIQKLGQVELFDDECEERPLWARKADIDCLRWEGPLLTYSDIL